MRGSMPASLAAVTETRVPSGPPFSEPAGGTELRPDPYIVAFPELRGV